MKSVDVIQEHSHIRVLFDHILTTWDHFEFMDIKDPNISNFLLFKTFFFANVLLNAKCLGHRVIVEGRFYRNQNFTKFLLTKFFLLNFLYQN